MNLEHERVGFTTISDVEIPEVFFNRLKVDDESIDSIFGDGLLKGSTISLIAEAGVGKTRFALTLCDRLIKNNYKAGYASGEESVYQIAYNSRILNIKNVKIATITDVDEICDAMESFDFLVIDSFQSITTKQNLNSREHVKQVANKLVKKAKETECCLLIIVQVNSDGKMKSGTTIPHTVDVNVRIDKNEELGIEDRIIEVYKNRFGPVGKHHALMKSHGYEFLGEYSEPEKESKSKNPVCMERKDAILNMQEPPYITIDRVVEELNVSSQTAGNLLRDLVNENKLQKFGRGNDAVWKQKEVCQKTFLTSMIQDVKTQLEILKNESD